MAKTFGTTPEEVEKRYKSIRTSYGRYLKKRTLPTGTGTKDVPHVPEFQNLDWLNVYIEHRDTTSNVTKSVTLDPTSGSNQQPSDESIVVVSDQELASYSDPRAQSPDNTSDSTDTSVCVKEEKVKLGEKRPWSKYSRNNKLDEALIKTIGSISQILDNDAKKCKEDTICDEEELFCKSLVPQLKRLPSRLKQQSKIQIQQLLFNYEFHQQQQWKFTPENHF